MIDIVEIGEIRFRCTTHDVVLKNNGNGNVFYPTYSLAGADDDFEARKDDAGWLTLDTSELYCPDCSDELEQDIDINPNWVIEAR